MTLHAALPASWVWALFTLQSWNPRGTLCEPPILTPEPRGLDSKVCEVLGVGGVMSLSLPTVDMNFTVQEVNWRDSSFGLFHSGRLWEG